MSWDNLIRLHAFLLQYSYINAKTSPSTQNTTHATSVPKSKPSWSLMTECTMELHWICIIWVCVSVGSPLSSTDHVLNAGIDADIVASTWSSVQIFIIFSLGRFVSRSDMKRFQCLTLILILLKVDLDNNHTIKLHAEIQANTFSLLILIYFIKHIYSIITY